MMKQLQILCAAGATLVIAGCATGRVADLRDCGRLSVGYGLGLGVEVGLGAVGNPSLGLLSNKAMFGWEDRNCAGMWTETEAYWPASSAMGVLMGGLSDGSSRGPGHPYFAPYGRHINEDTHLRREDWRQYERSRNFVGGTGKYDMPPTPTFRSATDIECGVTLAILSVRIGVNPLEMIDFLLGFGGIDIAKDDSKTKANQAPEDTARKLADPQR